MGLLEWLTITLFGIILCYQLENGSFATKIELDESRSSFVLFIISLSNPKSNFVDYFAHAYSLIECVKINACALILIVYTSATVLYIMSSYIII